MRKRRMLPVLVTNFLLKKDKFDQRKTIKVTFKNHHRLKIIRACSSVVEYLVCTEEILGSIPSRSILFCQFNIHKNQCEKWW